MKFIVRLLFAGVSGLTVLVGLPLFLLVWQNGLKSSQMDEPSVAVQKQEIVSPNQFRTVADSEAVTKTETTVVPNVPVEPENMNFKWLRQVAVWSIVICSLPVFTILFIRRLIKLNSNQVNGLTLAGYTVAGTLLACFTISSGLEGWLWLASLVTATLIAVLYNIWIMSVAVRLEK